MKTILLSTVTQTLLTIVIFTVVFINSTDVNEYQVRYFSTSMIAVSIPLLLFNIIGFVTLKFIINKSNRKNSRRRILLISFIIGTIISTAFALLTKSSGNFLGIEITKIEYVLLQAFFWVIMAGILSFYFMRYNLSTNSDN